MDAVGIEDAGQRPASPSSTDSSLDGYQYFHSTRASLLRRLDRADEAREEYERALELAHTEPERHFLLRRLVEVGA
jgi:RNA polymerase sigma-70 factor (ECF subfamily)